MSMLFGRGSARKPAALAGGYRKARAHGETVFRGTAKSIKRPEETGSRVTSYQDASGSWLADARWLTAGSSRNLPRINSESRQKLQVPQDVLKVSDTIIYISERLWFAHSRENFLTFFGSIWSLREIFRIKKNCKGFIADWILCVDNFSSSDYLSSSPFSFSNKF